MPVVRQADAILSGARIKTPRATAAQAVATMIRQQMLAGEYAIGERLSSEPELAKSLGTSRVTVREALSHLEAEGLVVRRRGIGTFVLNRRPLENSLHLNFGVAQLIRAMGREPGIAQSSWCAITADEFIAERLGIDVGDAVMSLQRVHTADDQAVVYSVDYLPRALIQGEMPMVILSAFEFLRDYCNVEIAFGEAVLRPELLTEPVATALQVPKDSLCLVIEQVDFGADGSPALLSVEHHLASAFTFTLMRRDTSQ